MTPILSTIYSTFTSTTNILSNNTTNQLPINTKMPSSIYQFDEISYIYETTLQKFNNYNEQEKSLRKFVLLRNFYINQFLNPDNNNNNNNNNNNDQLREKNNSDNENSNFTEHFNEKLEWSDDDIKKEEETWLDACLDNASLGEYDDGYVYIIKPGDSDDEQKIDEGGESVEKELIINYKEEIIIPNDSPLEGSKIDNDSYYSNNNISDQEFHPYWKDNSIIRQSKPTTPLPPSIDHYRPFFDQKSKNISNNHLEKNNNNNNIKTSGSNFKIRSFSIPKIFHKYKLGHAILDLLQSDDQSSQYFFEKSITTNRSQDDLDMLFYSPPKDLLDHGMLSDIISMLEWYGGKKNDSLDNITTATTVAATEIAINTNNNLFVENIITATN